MFHPSSSTHVSAQFWVTSLIPVLVNVFHPSSGRYVSFESSILFFYTYGTALTALSHACGASHRGNPPHPPHLYTCLIPVVLHITSNCAHFHKIYLIFHWCTNVAIPVASFMSA